MFTQLYLVYIIDFFRPVLSWVVACVHTLVHKRFDYNIHVHHLLRKSQVCIDFGCALFHISLSSLRISCQALDPNYTRVSRINPDRLFPDVTGVDSEAPFAVLDFVLLPF